MEKITYGFYNYDFGEIILGKSDKGLCWLGFMVEGYNTNFDSLTEKKLEVNDGEPHGSAKPEWLTQDWHSKNDNRYKGDGYSRMLKHFPDAQFIKSNLDELGDKIIKAWEQGRERDINLDLRGTKFQISVWKELLNINKGRVKSYGDLAKMVGKPKAARAVGSAVGQNPVSLIVPCHRIIQKSGKIGNYGWGVELKRQILDAEGVFI